MQTSYDSYGLPEIPYMILCNPNEEQLFSLALSYDTKLTLRLNALSEYEFNFPKSIDGGETEIPAYTYLQNKRLVLLEGYGYFQIIDSQENLDGRVPFKTVKCSSLEIELTNKRVSVFSGTKKLYDLSDPTDTILGDMLLLAPNWSVGDVDADLCVKYRTFKISDSNVYKFLMEDVSKAFECIFFFDTLTKTISVKTLENAVTPTDIFLSFDNVIKTATFSEKSDEITTCLSVYGGKNLTIRGVNPLGTERIYNFDYYATTEWMTAGLVNAINAWKVVVDSHQTAYSNYLRALKTRNEELIVLNTSLTARRAEMTALVAQQAIRIQLGQNYDDITILINAKQVEINSLLAQITTKENQIDVLETYLENIADEVGFANNFTNAQLLELNNFIYENTYKNDNIIQTTTMTPPQVQEAQQDLYEQGQSVLERVSQPRYEFTFESANYFNIPEFSSFTNATDIGSTATIELEDGTTIVSVLLEISITFDNPKDFTLKFSNRVRLDGVNFIYSDLLGTIISTGSTVSFNSEGWSDWEESYKDSVSTFIDSALDAAKNEVISSTNQEIVLNANGLRGRKKTDTGYDPIQVWLTSSVLAFTNDNWNSAKLALGRITTPSGSRVFGLVADAIVGTLIAGNNLRIMNDDNSFIVDNAGVRIHNATVTITRGTDVTANSKIFLDPAIGFKIQAKVGGTWKDKIVIESDGDVSFSGKLSAATGSFTGSITASSGRIGGWVIDSYGLKDTVTGNYIRTTIPVGDTTLIKLGAMTVMREGSSYVTRFAGKVQADQIEGELLNHQIGTGLDASKVTFGTLGADVIYAGEINWAGDVRMYSGGYGIAMIQTPQLKIFGTYSTEVSAAIELDATDMYGGFITLKVKSTTGQNKILIWDDGLQISGNIKTSLGYGTVYNTVSTDVFLSGLTYLSFVNGMLVTYG